MVHGKLGCRLAGLNFVPRKNSVTRQDGFLAVHIDAVNGEAHATFRFFVSICDNLETNYTQITRLGLPSWAALINDQFLHTQIAMRGGTLLHKVHLAPASRYSEDIDLVVFGDRPEEYIRKALRRVLADVVENPKTSWSRPT